MSWVLLGQTITRWDTPSMGYPPRWYLNWYVSFNSQTPNATTLGVSGRVSTLKQFVV